MTRPSKLRPVRGSADKAETNVKGSDRFDEVLDAFAGDLPSEELPPEELDRLYSEALAEGLLSERKIHLSFEALLDRRVLADPETGALSLAPVESPTVGQLILLYREQRSLTVEQLAGEHQVSSDQLRGLEKSADVYDPERLSDLAKAIAVKTGISVARLNTLLQSIRATLELRSADGPMLMAARKAPPK